MLFLFLGTTFSFSSAATACEHRYPERWEKNLWHQLLQFCRPLQSTKRYHVPSSLFPSNLETPSKGVIMCHYFFSLASWQPSKPMNFSAACDMPSPGSNMAFAASRNCSFIWFNRWWNIFPTSTRSFSSSNLAFNQNRPGSNSHWGAAGDASVLLCKRLGHAFNTSQLSSILLTQDRWSKESRGLTLKASSGAARVGTVGSTAKHFRRSNYMDLISLTGLQSQSIKSNSITWGEWSHIEQKI